MTINWTMVANLMTAGGFGAIVGGVLNSIIQVVGKRGTDRADIADRLTESADRWLVRVEADNARLIGENRKLREAVVAVIEVLDDLIDSAGLPPEECAKLKAANRTAKDAVF